MTGHLQHQMSGRAESREAEQLAIGKSGKHQRSISDRSRTQKRRSLHIRKDMGNGINKIFIDNHELSISAMVVASRRSEIHAQIFHTPATILALPTCGKYPCDADTLTLFESFGLDSIPFNDTHNLMPRDHRINRWRRPTLDLI